MFKFIKRWRERRFRKYCFLKTLNSCMADEMKQYIENGKIEYPLGHVCREQ